MISDESSFRKMKYSSESLRLTAFFLAGSVKDLGELGNGIWSRIATEPAEEDSSRPKEFTRTLKGNLSDTVSMLLTVTPARVDLLLLPIVSSAPENFPNLGEQEEAIKLLAEKCDQFYAGLTDVVRLAVGGNFLCFTKDNNETYNLFSEVIPSIDWSGQDVSDFFYRLNRPTTSKVVAGMKLNRLCSWAAIRLQGFVPLGTRMVSMNAHHALRVEIDVNTDAERVDAIDADPVTLAKELTESVLDRLLNGDRP